MSNEEIVVFTDGASKGNPGPGGWGVVIVTPDGRVRELGGASSHTTNNQMELSGPIAALEHLRDTAGRIRIHTDSTYVIKGMSEWIHGWERRGWKTMDGKDVLNRELWEQLAELVRSRARGDLEWHYVKGHAGIPGNERCDAIANDFALRGKSKLYDGPLVQYEWPVLDIPDETRLPQRSGGTSGSKGKTAYSYLSAVDGVPMRHTTWPECERRVKGRSGARFKKAMSATDEAAILRGWGFSPDALGR